MVRTSVLNDALNAMNNAEKSGRRQVMIRPSSKVIVKFLHVMQKHGTLLFLPSFFFLFVVSEFGGKGGIKFGLITRRISQSNHDVCPLSARYIENCDTHGGDLTSSETSNLFLLFCVWQLLNLRYTPY